MEEQFFSHKEEGLEKLALLLDQNNKYAVGELPTLSSTDLASMLGVLGQSSYNRYLPGWRVIKAVYDKLGEGSCQQYILPAVGHPLAEDSLFSLFDWLEKEYSSADEQKRQEVLICHLKYLEVLAGLSSRNLLAKINLLNQVGHWRPAAELCADAEGVSSVSLLNREQQRILSSLLPEQKRTTWSATANTTSQTGQMPERRDLDPELQTTAEELSQYFKQWESLMPPEVVSGFLAILGDDPRMLNLATHFQGRHTVEWIRENVPWKTHHDTGQGGARLWGYGLDFFQALSQMRFIIDFVAGQEVSVTSLLGKTISVPLDTDFNSLILGNPYYECAEGDVEFVRIKIRRVSDEHISPEEFSEYLKATVEYILKTVYTQQDNDLTSLWDDLSKSEQLDVRIALRLVMKHIPFYLDQLGVHKHQLIAKAHNAWNDARYKVEEYHDKPEKNARYQQEEENRRLDLQNLLETDSAVQDVVLNSVRKKMRDFQYTDQSIPFELFQNADDAFVEQLEIEAHPGKQLSPTQTGHFVMQQDGDTVRFMHWGRPVNSTGAGGFPGRERGFHQDLEKMLILSSSNKSSEQHLTGKFGLGFKSVLLVSDTPRFISGRLGVEIIAGLYPRKLSGHKALYELLKQFSAGDKRPGTLIELPLRGNVSPKSLRQFSSQSGVLTVFSKRLRRIDLICPDKSQESAEWLPAEILSLPDAALERGSIICWDDKNKLQVDAIHFRSAQGGGVLVGINSQGCNALPNMPPIWIVAPTREKGNLGFCINGNFEVDAGRARLAGESGQNKNEAQRIG
ncbi:MAG: hypothetical protein PF495_19560, partial [Spirochaetales bacterium]|nr:hypothetical protein [Spirochaetales bacterium]